MKDRTHVYCVEGPRFEACSYAFLFGYYVPTQQLNEYLLSCWVGKEGPDHPASKSRSPELYFSNRVIPSFRFACGTQFHFIPVLSFQWPSLFHERDRGVHWAVNQGIGVYCVHPSTVT